jgi:hypothetical protein
MNLVDAWRDFDGVIREALVVEQTSVQIKHGQNPADSLDDLSENLKFLVRNDRRDLPTNLIVNCSWPMALGLGYRNASELLNSGDGSDIRLWYLPRPESRNELVEVELLAGEMTDIFDLTAPPGKVPPVHDDPRPVALVIHATSERVDDNAVRKARDLGVSEDRIDSRILHERTDKDPRTFKTQAIAIAEAIQETVSSTSGAVYLSLRVTKEEAFFIGVLLQIWNVNLNRCRFLRYSGRQSTSSFDVWNLELGHGEEPLTSALDNAAETLGDTSLINATPHSIHLLDEMNTTIMEIPPGGISARVDETTQESELLAIGSHRVEITSIDHGPVENLPEPKDGQLVIVSRITALAVPERRDLIFPLDEVRQDGQIIGCRQFGRLSPR